ncbi:uncharacterized protein LOC141891787 [Acropora palmata]|uniref:uncharacterized protein LOC141891787 n=1 Tax=Acropora palmata TaxID=6131 RepID=UPI003DA1756C
MDFSSSTSSVPYESTVAHTMSVADHINSQRTFLFNPVTPDVSPPKQMTDGGLTMKSKDISQVLEYSNVTNADIEEMEEVRGHLHMMLQNCKGLSDNREFDHTPSATTDCETQENYGDKESVISMDTTALLHRLLPNASPLSEVQFQTEDQSGRQMVSFADDRKLKGSQSSKVVTTDKSLLSENSLLKEQVERERFRRKHCEQQIQELHGKLLENQQQLAVAVSADRKKDAMIEQLDKTLAKVVDGWKKHEGEKVTIINQLKVERENAEQSQQRQREMLLQFEKELAQAVEALTKEQQKAVQAENEKQTQLKQQMEERTKLLECLSNEKETVALMEKEKEGLRTELEEIKIKFDEVDEALKEQTNFVEELEARIANLTTEHEMALLQEKEKLNQEIQKGKDCQAVLTSVQKDIQRLEMEQDTSNREKESLKMELRLMEAKHEANKTKEETEKQAELEREMTKRLEEIHSQMSKTESEMRESHRKQLQEMNVKHKEDLQQQLAKFHDELKKKEVKLKTTSDDYEERIRGYQEKLASLAINTRQSMEKERQALSLRLEQMMQSHCNEALNLLKSSAAKFPDSLPGMQQFTGSYNQDPFKTSIDPSLKWQKDNELQTDKMPFTAAKIHPSFWQQQQQHPKLADKALSIVLPPSKPQHNTTPDNSHTDSGVSSLTSYLSINSDAEKHGFLSHGQSNTEFYPLHTYVESNSPEAKEDTKLNDITLMEQTLEPESTLLSVFPHEVCSERQISSGASQDISEKLEEQESRQAELNHYVKMLLQRSPGDEHFEEKDQFQNGLILISSSKDEKGDSHTSSGVISPIQSDPQNDQYDMGLSLHHAVTVSSTNPDTYQDGKHNMHATQAAFTKTTVLPGMLNMPSQARGHIPSQIPYSRETQVPPHTPPRRERDSDNHPPPRGTLTPQQVGQLSRMLGMFSEPGQPQFTAEQLYSYLRGVQDRSGSASTEHTLEAHPPESKMRHNTQEQHMSGPGHKTRKESPPQASHKQQTGADSKTRRNLDSNMQRKQAQVPQTQGPSVNGRPISRPGGQDTTQTEQPSHLKSHRQQARQLASNFGPPMRYPGGPPVIQEAGTNKPASKVGTQSKETKKIPLAGKHAKPNAWR